MSGLVDWERRLLTIRANIATGNIEKLFGEEYIVIDLLKVLYEDSLDASSKVELLVLLESYGGYGGIQSSSVDQIIASLLDVFHQYSGRTEGQSLFLEQLLLTITTLLVQYDQLDGDIFKRSFEAILNVATSPSNVADTKRLRSCACQCLIQFEEWLPGCLWKEKETLRKILKLERSDVYQDYLLLVVKVVEHAICNRSNGNGSPGVNSANGNKLDRQFSSEPQEMRQMVSMVMENVAVLTPSGLWHIVLSLVNFIHNLPEMSAMIFKPLMLHHMATMDISTLHLVLYLQREFEKEVLTEGEEKQLIQRLLTSISHPSLSPAHRLFVCHWTRHHSLSCDEGTYLLPTVMAERYRLCFFPSVFDPPDCQLAKLCLFNLCFPPLPEEPSGVAAALLLGSVGYLHKLVWHTGSDRVAVVLFRALFHMYQRHCSKSFSQDINRFLRGLISGFPYFIPHALDFIECLRNTTPDSPVYTEILSLLHHQVVTTPEDQAAAYFYFYLQVMKSASLRTEIEPKSTVKFLSYLAEHSIMIDDGSWLLGNGILSVIQNLLVCHGTEDLYLAVGDLLFYMMTYYRDMDVRDKSLFLYALLTSSTDEKIRGLLRTMSRAQSVHEALSTILPGALDKNKGQIIVLDMPIFSLDRTDMTAEIDKTASAEEQSEADGTVEDYIQRLQKCSSFLTASYSLSLTNDKLEKVLAVTVHIDTEDTLEKVKDIHISRLEKKESHLVTLAISPRKPLPCHCHVWIEFLDGKQTYKCQTEAVTLTLEDFLLPLQTDLSGGGASDLFDLIWQWCTNNNDQDDGNIPGIESVKVLHMSLSEFTERTNQKLHRYKVSDTDNTDPASVLKFGMFLPTRYHLLLSCRETNSNVCVSMATDFYRILPYIDAFLTDL
ncbi:AP-5 complex subunit beta-1-like [Mizuhopecten yessoensis]|uniref:AP-5 complex subunit beta-1-like n=1 Tax=Mizuhopecten yessoensis TaxID=6573 RepID=UPI000B45E0B4|nr:AP-5 complex subunit beta-1-like [Mizuhopecten yessoensis]